MMSLHRFLFGRLEGAGMLESGTRCRRRANTYTDTNNRISLMYKHDTYLATWLMT